MPEFNTDFERAIQVEKTKVLGELRKNTSAIAELLGPKGTAQGGVDHIHFVGPVEWQDDDTSIVYADTPNAQHPSRRTRASADLKASIVVALPRGVGQVTGDSVQELASKYMGEVQAGMMVKIEDQVGQLLQGDYRENVIMDGREISPSVASFNSAGQDYSPRGDSRTNISNATQDFFHVFNVVRARARFAQARRKGLTESSAMGPGVGSIDDVNYIIWCSNNVWLKVLEDNYEYFTNRDYSSVMASVETDLLRVQTLNDVAIKTTSAAIDVASRPTEIKTTGTSTVAPGATASPILILPRGNFMMNKLAVDNFKVQIKENPNKRWEQVIYGECNVRGVRVYDELLQRYWLNAGTI